MGTSSQLSTPSGGKWAPVKRQVTSFLGGGSATAASIVGNTVSAAGAIGSLSRRQGSSGAGGGGGRATVGRDRVSVSRAVSALGGFAESLQESGLDAAIGAIGLADLSGRTAIEVVSRIAEHMAASAEGVAKDLMSTALREAILEAAAIQGDLTYQNLESSLQEFLAREGIEGLIEGFLTQLVFDQVWVFIEEHAEQNENGSSAAESLAAAIEQVCRNQVRDEIAASKAAGRFERTDWFGRSGQQAARAIVSDLETRLRALGD